MKKNLQPNTKKQQRRLGAVGERQSISLSPCRILLTWNTSESKICYHDQGMYSWSFWASIYRSSLAQIPPLSGLKLCTENITHIEMSTLNLKGTVTMVTSCTPTKGMRLLQHSILLIFSCRSCDLPHHINFTAPKKRNHCHQKDFLNAQTDKGSEGAVKDTMLQRGCLECRRWVFTYSIAIQIIADQLNLQKFIHGAAEC